MSGIGALDLSSQSRIGDGKSVAFRFDDRHVLYAKLRPYLNKVALPTSPGRSSTELVPLRPVDGVDREYLAHVLRRPETVQYVMASVTGARMPRTDMSVLMAMPIPLPPLEEQRRIVYILNRAASIRRLRDQANAILRALIPALFIKMFGDPAENPMGWQRATIDDLFVVRGGKRLPKGSRYSDHPTAHRYVRAADIEPDEVLDHDARYITPDLHAGIARYVIDPTDTIITIAGKIGVAAPADVSLAGANLTENAARLCPRPNAGINNKYLSSLLNSQFVQRQIAVRTGQVTIGKLALERIRTIEILVPPIGRQMQFAELRSAVRSSMKLASDAAAVAEALQSAISSRLLGVGDDADH